MNTSPFNQKQRNIWRRLLNSFFFAVLRSKAGLLDFLRCCCEKGVLSQNSLRMIEGVFHVGELRVRDIMVPRMQMVVISKDATLEQIYKTVIDSGHSRFPVINEKQEVAEGVLLAKDLLRYDALGKKAGFNIKDHLRLPTFIPESKRLSTLLNEFRRTRNHMAVVVDEYGSISGLVTIEDVLEQIVGDITDEHDAAEDAFVDDYGNGKYLVKALMPVADFNEYFAANFDVTVADTIGGFLIQTLGHLPKRGEKKRIGHFLFEVSRADIRRVHSLALTIDS